MRCASRGPRPAPAVFLALAFLVGTITMAHAAPTQAAVPSAPHIISEWGVPAGADPYRYTRLQQDLHVRQKASGHFWSTTFGVWKTLPTSGVRSDGDDVHGYTGLQTTDLGDLSIFSIWDARKARDENGNANPSCSLFDHEGEGMSCVRPGLNINTAHHYRFDVTRREHSPDEEVTIRYADKREGRVRTSGTWWRSEFTELAADGTPTAAPVVIAEIFVADVKLPWVLPAGPPAAMFPPAPRDQVLQPGSGNFSEIFGSTVMCVDNAPSVADNYAPHFGREDGSGDTGRLSPAVWDPRTCPEPIRQVLTIDGRQVSRVIANRIPTLTSRWSLPADLAPLTEVRQDMTVVERAPAQAALTELAWPGGDGATPATRMGIETAADLADPAGDRFVLSAPGATGATPGAGGSCEATEVEGVAGFRCALPAALTGGSEQNLAFGRIGSWGGADVWLATARTFNGDPNFPFTVLGVIQMPVGHDRLAGVTTRTQWRPPPHSPRPACGAAPRSRTRVKAPQLNASSNPAGLFARYEGSDHTPCIASTAPRDDAAAEHEPSGRAVLDLGHGGPVDEAAETWNLTASQRNFTELYQEIMLQPPAAAGATPGPLPTVNASVGLMWRWHDNRDPSEIGVQTKGLRLADLSTGPLAAGGMPVWQDAMVTRPPSPAARCFTHAAALSGMGLSQCRVPVTLQPGRRYALVDNRSADSSGLTDHAHRLRLIDLGADNARGGIGANADRATELGTYRSPRGQRILDLRTVVNITGPETFCDAGTRTVVRAGAPTVLVGWTRSTLTSAGVALTNRATCPAATHALRPDLGSTVREYAVG